MIPDAGPSTRHLFMVGDDDDAPPARPSAAAPPALAKQHPSGVWDMPAAPGYRRIAGVDSSGNLAIEVNMSDRIPEHIRKELEWALETAMERSIQALKV